MDFTQIILDLIKRGDVWGIAFALFVMFVGLRLKPMGGGPQRPSSSGQDALGPLVSRLDEIDSRLNQVEGDLVRLPTVQDVHDIQLQQVRQSEKLLALEATLGALTHSVSRIENFLLNIPKGEGQ